MTGIERRHFLKGAFGLAAATAVGIPLAGCSSDGTTSGQTGQTSAGQSTTGVVASPGPTSGGGSGNATTTMALPSRPFGLGSYGGPYQAGQVKAFFDPVLGPKGIQRTDVTLATATLMAQMQLQVENKAVEWDIVDINEYLVHVAEKRGLLEPIDYSVVDKSQLPEGSALTYGVPFGTIGRVLCWNKKFFDESTAPKGWQDFWDLQKFPGKRGFLNYVGSGAMEAALMADGVKPEDLYPLDLDRAFKSLDKIKAALVPAVSGAQQTQMLVDANVPMAFVTEGRLNEAVGKGAPWVAVRHNSLYVREVYVIPKGSGYAQIANQVLALAVTPQPQATFSDAVGYGPINVKAYDLLSAAARSKFSSSPEFSDQGVVLMSASWYADNIDEATRLYTKWTGS